MTRPTWSDGVCKPLGFAGPFRPGGHPQRRRGSYAAASIIAGEVDLPLLKTLAGRGPVALDVQGFVRVRDGDDLRLPPMARHGGGAGPGDLSQGGPGRGRTADRE